MPKGNISLIMLFVLAIGSVIGLMSTNFLQSMIRETSSMQTSYQTYYLAKAGIELGTLAIQRYDYGFEDELTGSNPIFQNNLKSCASGCIIDMKITSRFTGGLIGNTPEPIANSQCTTSQSIKIPACSSQILPLFLDDRKLGDTTVQAYTDNLPNYQNVQFEPKSNTGVEIGLGLVLGSGDRFIYDTDEELIDNPVPLFITNSNNSSDLFSGYLVSKLSANNSYFNYLTITNISSDTINGCIRFQDPGSYALDTSLVTSTATFKNSSLSLKGVIKKELAGYVLAGYAGDNCDEESDNISSESTFTTSITQ